MFESLFESRRAGRPLWRPATFGVAVGLHLCVLAAIVVEGQGKAPSIGERPIQVSFLRFASPAGISAPGSSSGSGPGSGSGLGPAAAAAPAAEVTDASVAPSTAPIPESSAAPPQPEVQAPSPMCAEIMQPQNTPETICTDPVATIPVTAHTGVERGVAGGVPGGVPGGIPGGAPGGIPGGTGLSGGPLRAGGGVSAPLVIERVKPEYPALALNARIEGEVRLEAVIRRDGAVGDIQVIQGLPLGCTKAAIEALRHWRFQPGEYCGVPVDVYFELTVDFILN